MIASAPIRSMIVLAVALCAGTGTAAAAGKAHEHGVLKLDVAIDGAQLTIEMAAPLDNLLGFERAPRNDAERKAAADLLARLRSADKAAALFVSNAEAQCRPSAADAQAPVLEPGAKATPNDGHAELVARYVFDCAKPDALRTLDVGLFDAYKRTQRIDVQVAGPKGQTRTTLKRPARTVRLLR